ncbi:hypothetical protein [Pseudomonas sp. PLMAX]|uniref:hypothetical protein n=1 Tax=Pseudomonas sp. PLMAX TaxID=2201998 RepID=UPI0038B6C8AF
MNKPSLDIYIVNGNITIFCGTHSDRFKNDILNSSLFSALVAAKPGTDREKSWSTYTDTLGKLFWVVNSRNTQRLEFKNKSLLDIVDQGADGDLPNLERQALADAFSALTKLQSDSLPVKNFVAKLQANTSTATNSDVSVSTTAILTIVCNNKSAITLQTAFRTAHPIAIDLLDRPELTSINNGTNNFRLMRCLLDEHRYNGISAKIQDKLVKKIEAELLHINLPTDK